MPSIHVLIVRARTGRVATMALRQIQSKYRSDMRKRLNSIARHVVCVAIILLMVVGYTRLIPANAITVALTFLLAVLLVATVWGLAEAITMSLTAFLAFNFFHD
jgi:K+-sensing histidine kinase KdpD